MYILHFTLKVSDILSTLKSLSYGVIIAKIAHGLCFAYDTNLVVMATSIEESEKNWTDRENAHKCLPFGEKNRENRSSRY